jgi:hypothetical protein
MFPIDPLFFPQRRSLARGIMKEFHPFSMAPLGGKAQSELLEGGYYSIAHGEGFGIAKILELEPHKLHVRVYKHKQGFFARPPSIDPTTRTLDTIHDKDGFGMGDLPLSISTFKGWEPMFPTYSEVKPRELEGCSKDTSNGGVLL